ncbi:5'-deoxynucleotidase [Marinobacter nanhaiticus D15-8W]|uniref:5'-deoxynucleotidase n=1 Tax=Marinobacter nanhaiticus D15-8W TaxID=626887 RepID=N6WVQ6_9GAMM|nr:5'-deoxynucleotidase [Marinobacter nanhaiticus]ENO15112.1 5'-deoxynucleotidase [Marinobacter nanhaiticus D15-8W]BES69189.1 5'-deoxynucleotidase [Marinobacter nanhaiticus D15-8W]
MPASLSHFFAYIARLRWIRRWGLMRNAIEENVATHSWEVATIAHALALISNRHFEGQVDADRVAAAALYHDATEVITGDMPTPVKYHSSVMREAFGEIEHKAEDELLDLLPASLKDDFATYVKESQWPEEVKTLVKAADRLSAWLKCQAEINAGNKEFEPAALQIRQRLEVENLPEVRYFLEVFAPSYSQPLDHLLGD